MSSYIGIIYFVVIFLSNTIGAMSGIGGGIIIKPVLDSIGADPLNKIVIYSSFAVFFMSISSTVKQYLNKTKINKAIAISLAFGSIVGGFLGNQTLSFLFTITTAKTIQTMQCIIMILMLIIIYIFTMVYQKQINAIKPLILIFVGITLGFVSTLLGIGGGPLNVALLFFIGFEIKTAMVYSIIIIFFSQLSQLTMTYADGGLVNIDPKIVLLCILPAALLGGYFGGFLNIKLKEKTIAKMYSLVLLGVFLLNVYNLYSLYF